MIPRGRTIDWTNLSFFVFVISFITLIFVHGFYSLISDILRVYGAAFIPMFDASFRWLMVILAHLSFTTFLLMLTVALYAKIKETIK
jgi:hypothetical protein